MQCAECNKYIFIFFAGDLLVFLVLKKKGRLQPCILTNMTAAYALASKAFYSPGKPNYTSEADWLFFRAMTVKTLLSILGYKPCKRRPGKVSVIHVAFPAMLVADQVIGSCDVCT